jgi:hypothetical protein
MSKAYSKLPNPQEVHTPPFLPHSPDLTFIFFVLKEASFVVTSLCKFILQQIAEVGNSEDSDKLIPMAFQSISEWILLDSWVFRKPYPLTLLLDALCISIGMKSSDEKKNFKPSDPIRVFPHLSSSSFFFFLPF